MRPISKLREVAPDIRGVFTDLDDTLTESGKLSDQAYAALWKLHRAGIRLVVVTGRPAGWCDAMARLWPVDAVLGENGALAYYEREGRLERLYHPQVAEQESVVKRLEEVRREILKKVPGSRVAKDQPYRMFDLAIDFREEQPDLGWQAAEHIRAIFEQHGAHAKVSSIHVNGWFGDYDKLAMTRLFAEQVWGEALDAEQHHYVFCGDSPNDAPMFGYFEHSCAVANIAPFVDQLEAKPAFITAGQGGQGFAELVEQLVDHSRTKAL